MFHLRMSVPEDKVGEVLDLLDGHPAVATLAQHNGASRKPVGDVITASVPREAATEVLDLLRSTGLPETGTISIEPVPTWLSRAVFEADEIAPGSSVDAVVWPEVTQRAYEDTELNWVYGSFMVLATLLAAIALLQGSQILVIGAMVLGPDFLVLAALGVALARHDLTLFRRGAKVLLGGFALGIGATIVIGALGRWWGWISASDLEGHPAIAFVYTPDRWSFIVALIAAAAGVLSLTSARIGGLAGVFISVTTIPAAANIAMGTVFGLWDEVQGSALQLLVNVTGMVLAGWLTLACQRYVWGRVSMTRSRLLRRRRELWRSLRERRQASSSSDPTSP